MADPRKFSQVPELTPGQEESTDKILVVDESDTTGSQSGPGGTVKRLPLSAVQQTAGHQYSRNFINLEGVDTTLGFQRYIADAINAQGPFTRLPGQEMLFYTYQYPEEAVSLPDAKGGLLQVTYYALNNDLLTLGGVGALEVKSGDVFVFSGPYDLNQGTLPELFIDLGDISTGPVEDYFNLGDTSQQPAVAWDISGETFITCIENAEAKVYLFVGSPGTYGPNAAQAVAADFTDITNQPGQAPSHSLTDHEDVVIKQVKDGHILRYNAAEAAFTNEYPEEIVVSSISLGAIGQDIAAGTVEQWRLSFNMEGVNGIEFTAVTPPTGAAIIFDVRLNGASIFSVKPQIDPGTSSTNASTVQQVLNNPGFKVVAGDLLEFVIDQVGSTDAGQGVKASVVYDRQRYLPAIPYERFLAYFSFDGDFTDKTANSNDGAAQGTPAPGFEQAVDGDNGVRFLFATSHGVQLPDNPDLLFTTGSADQGFAVVIKYQEFRQGASWGNMIFFATRNSDQTGDKGIRAGIINGALVIDSGDAAGPIKSAQVPNWNDQREVGVIKYIAFVDQGDNLDFKLYNDQGEIATGINSTAPNSRGQIHSRRFIWGNSLGDPYEANAIIAEAVIIDGACSEAQVMAMINELKTGNSLL